MPRPHPGTPRDRVHVVKNCEEVKNGVHMQLTDLLPQHALQNAVSQLNAVIGM